MCKLWRVSLSVPWRGRGGDLAGAGRGLGEEVAGLRWEGRVLAKERGALQGREGALKGTGQQVCAVGAQALWRRDVAAPAEGRGRSG